MLDVMPTPAEFLAQHKDHEPTWTPRGPFLNPEQLPDSWSVDSVPLAPRPKILLLRCPCGAEVVYPEA